MISAQLLLSLASLQAVFGMAVADFLKQPKWKQQNAKKALRPGILCYLGLFSALDAAARQAKDLF